jgi:hypothetical protein
MMFDGRADRFEIEPEPDEDSDEGRLRYGGEIGDAVVEADSEDTTNQSKSDVWHEPTLVRRLEIGRLAKSAICVSFLATPTSILF